MSIPTPEPKHGAAIGLDHVGIIGEDLDALAQGFTALGFHVTPFAAHASGRTGNRCVMLRDGGYLELIATLPGQTSATLDRFLARGPGAHILALEVADEAAAMDRLRRAGIAGDLSITERAVAAGPDNPTARFALIMPSDTPQTPGRVLLIRHLTRGLLWRPANMVHPNRALALTEAVYGSDAPAEIMTLLSRLSGRPAEPDPLGGYRITLARGRVRVLPRAAAATLFPGQSGEAPLIGLTIVTDVGSPIAPDHGGGRLVHAGGLTIRFVSTAG